MTLRKLLGLTAMASLALPVEAAAQLPPPPPGPSCTQWVGGLPEGSEGKGFSAPVVTSSPVEAKLTTAYVPGQMPSWGLPPGLSLSKNVLQGTPTKPGLFYFNLETAVSYACPGSVPGAGATWIQRKEFSVRVRDVHAPQVTAFTVTPSALPASGGEVMVVVEASDNVVVYKVLVTQLRPDGHQGSFYVPGPENAPSGRWQQALTLAGNSSANPVTYSYTLSVQDRDGNVTKGGPVKVTLAGHAAAAVPVIKRP